MENNERICQNCGQPLSPNAKFCPECGQPCGISRETAQAPAPSPDGVPRDFRPEPGEPTSANPAPESPAPGNSMPGNPMPGNPMPGNPVPDAPKAWICPKCGTTLQNDQLFCPNCGTRIAPAVPFQAPVGFQTNYPPYPQPNPGKKKTAHILIAVGVALAVMGIVAVGILGVFFLMQSNSVDSIVLSEASISIRTGESQTVSYTIEPEKAADKEVAWSTSDESVATVSQNGEITGQKEGTCIITAKVGGKEDSMTVTVSDTPDLAKIYSDLGKPSYCDLAEDGSFLSIDTNPYDRDDYINMEAHSDLEEIIKMLDLPQSLFEEMLHTRALDGTQREEYDHVSVSWTYHPDQGLEVTFKVR